MIVAGASNFVVRADNKPTEKPAAAAKVAGDREVMEQDEKDEETADGKGRLPVYFAKLGLTPAGQRSPGKRRKLNRFSRHPARHERSFAGAKDDFASRLRSLAATSNSPIFDACEKCGSL